MKAGSRESLNQAGWRIQPPGLQVEHSQQEQQCCSSGNAWQERSYYKCSSIIHKVAVTGGRRSHCNHSICISAENEHVAPGLSYTGCLDR